VWAIRKVIKPNPITQAAIKSWIEIARIEDGFLFRGIRNKGKYHKELIQGRLIESIRDSLKKQTYQKK